MGDALKEAIRLWDDDQGGDSLRGILVATDKGAKQVQVPPPALSEEGLRELMEGNRLAEQARDLHLLTSAMRILFKHDMTGEYSHASTVWSYVRPPPEGAQGVLVPAPAFVDAVRIDLGVGRHLVCFYLGAPDGDPCARRAFNHLEDNASLTGVKGPVLIIAGEFVRAGDREVEMPVSAPPSLAHEPLLKEVLDLVREAVRGRYEDTYLRAPMA